MSNPAYLDRAHPVRVILERAAYSGSLPTKAELDKLAEVSDAVLPDGHTLARFRRHLVAGAQECAGISATGAHATARSRADELAAEMAVTMSPEERDVDTFEVNPEPLDDIARRMFSH